jgi:hypothetical protein
MQVHCRGFCGRSTPTIAIRSQSAKKKEMSNIPQGTLEVSDLNRLDQADLRSLAEDHGLEGDAVQFRDASVPSAAHGELGVVLAIFTLTQASLVVAAIWMGRRYRAGKRTDRVDLVLPDGTRISREITLEFESDEPPSEQFIKQVARLAKLDVEQLLSDVKRIEAFAGGEN